MPETEFPDLYKRGCTLGIWQRDDVPNDQGRIQHGHGNHHSDNQTRDQAQDRVGVRERHDSQADILREE